MSDDLRELRAKGKGSAVAARITRLDELIAPVGSAPWSLNALRGRLVELSAHVATATLTMAIELVLEAQLAAEPVGWVTQCHRTFYPPDVADAGIDLTALSIVWVKDARMAGRTAERLLRSGAFGLVILDLSSSERDIEERDIEERDIEERDIEEHDIKGTDIKRTDIKNTDIEPEISTNRQGRLVTLVQIHNATILCITEKLAEVESIGSLVSLRAEAVRMCNHVQTQDVTLTTLKDKRRGPGWLRTITLLGPAGC